MKLTGRTVLITGGSGGIGTALAVQLLSRGNTVIVTGRDAQKLAAAQRALPGLHTIQSDVSDESAVRALHAEVLAQFPALDTLVNNAGIMRNLNLRQARELSDVTREIAVNLSGPVQMVQQFLPHLSTRPGALIVNVTSGLAFIPLAISPVYSAAKAGLHAYTLALRAQLSGTGVTVIEVAPPPVETALFRGEFAAEVQDQKGMAPEALARQMIRSIEAGQTEIRPGAANLLRAMTRLAPTFMFRQMGRMMMPKQTSGTTSGAKSDAGGA
jgi:uncharacterized oxidoreductase